MSATTPPPSPTVPARKRSRSLSLLLDLAIPLILLAAFTAACWIWPIDLTVQSTFYDAQSGGWPFKDDQPWHFLYHYGTIPALTLALASLALFALSFRKGKIRRWRKIGLFFALALILGPALLVNLTLKEHWGRPRPRDVQEFGGKFAYEKPLEYDASSPGKSFPCGHCSMAFVFLSGFLVLRASRKKLAWLALAAALAFGTLMGFARMNQGGHFLSDVVWSAATCYLSAVFLFYVLGLDKGVLQEPPPPKKSRIPTWAIAVCTLLALGAIFGILLNTPYHQTPSYTDDPSLSDGATSAKFSLLLEPGNHSVAHGGETLTITSKHDGFGLPGSAIKDVTKQRRDDGEFYFQFKQRTSGLFIELSHQLDIRLPDHAEKSFTRLAQHGGTLTLTPSGTGTPHRWQLQLGGLEKLVLALPKDTPAKLIWPLSTPLPSPLSEIFHQTDTPHEFRTGKEKPALVLEFDLGEKPPPAIQFP